MLPENAERRPEGRRPSTSTVVESITVEMPPEESHLGAAIDTCEDWIARSPDPSIRAAFRLALHELWQLIPARTGR